MARSRIFNKYFPASRRYRSGGSKKIFLVIIVVALIATVSVRYFNPVVPAMTGSFNGAGLSRFLPDQSTVFYRILDQVIPGISQPVPVNNESGSGENENLFGQTISRLDPRDPRRIFSTQIPYLMEVGLDLQPLVYQAGHLAESDREAPRIIIPTYTIGSGSGEIIIYHTHTTESFLPTSGERFSEDLELTVARLGAELARILHSNYGIPVVHNRQIHDIPRNPSYEVALHTLRELLAAHPQASLVVDLHRDGVDRNITTTHIDGQPTGKILFVVGSRHPDWRENYRRAQFLHEVLEEIAPGLSRGVRERPLVYNQHLHAGSLLIEVGGHENSLEEVLRTMPILAKALARLYQNG